MTQPGLRQSQVIKIEQNGLTMESYENLLDNEEHWQGSYNSNGDKSSVYYRSETGHLAELQVLSAEQTAIHNVEMGIEMG